MWWYRSSPLRKPEPGVVGHLAAPKFTSQEGRARSHWDTWQHRSSPLKEARTELRDTWQHRISPQHGHVVVSEPTSVGRRGLKLQLMWQHVDARPAPYLDLDLVCGGTRCSGYRHGHYCQIASFMEGFWHCSQTQEGAHV
jgi:hypothetical protein